jgi:hypothetical protein
VVSPKRSVPLLLALFAVVLPASASADVPLQDGVDNDTRGAAVAYNSDADQYFVVYTTSFGRLEGQIRDADGTLLDTIVEVLPHSVGETVYREPRITYRPADDQYVMVSILEIDGLIPTVDVTVTALDTDGNLLWTDDAPGWVDPTATTPDVMGDPFGNCCTLVTWKQSYGSIFAQRYDADGAPQGSRVTIYADGGETSSRAFNPRIAYQRAPNDDFAVVWQLARNGNPGLLQARVVEPVSGTLGAVQTLATMVADPWARFGETFPGGPDIAYDEVGDRYYVAWRDEDGVWLTRPTASLAGSTPFRVFTDTASSGYIAQGGTPEVTVADGFGKVYVSHPLRMSGVFGPSSPAYWVHGWWYTATGTFGESPLSTWWFAPQADNVVASFSPVTDTVFGVWERDEPGAFVPAPNDLYYELEDVP